MFVVIALVLGLVVVTGLVMAFVPSFLLYLVVLCAAAVTGTLFIHRLFD